jgi:hypothetical protein
LSAIAMLLAGCVSVHAVTAPKADLRRYHRFAFYPASDFDQIEFTRSPAGQAIRRQVMRALEPMGVALSDEQPDFWVSFYLVVEEREMAPYAAALGPLYRAAPGATRYLRATVVIDFIDPVTRDVFWRGTAQSPLAHPENPDPRKVAIAVDQVMRRHPLRRVTASQQARRD